MRILAMTGMLTTAWISLISLGSLIRATPPWARISEGTRSNAITAQAPALSAILACLAVPTSMITPPLSMRARSWPRMLLFFTMDTDCTTSTLYTPPIMVAFQRTSTAWIIILILGTILLVLSHFARPFIYLNDD